MTRTRLLQWLRQDRGNASLETAVLAPVLIAVLGLMVAFGRITDAEGAVDAAAHAAARAASLERDAGTAQSAAQDAVTRSLDGDGVTCQTSNVALDTSGYATGVGEAATVTAAISCTATLSDIGVPGLPGAKTLTAEWTSPIDTYRARQ
ncbi:TadE/TadG family type IV pilus assembly protein [Streptomyces xiangluensis]|uniref:TadE/TadG family type IV pilus assembly protein n=1 Tax=Streptomyces xiangluensis TaxID=2665720 RepID=A0ABV8Z1F4_9ACTN